MVNRRKRRWQIGILIFIALVIISGFALAQSGHMENPFQVFSMLGVGNAEGRPERDFEPAGEGQHQAGQPPTAPRSEAFGRHGSEGDRGGGTTIAWSQIGDVLFDIWFICAVTAVVIVVSYPLGWFRQRRRATRQQVAAAG